MLFPFSYLCNCFDILGHHCRNTNSKLKRENEAKKLKAMTKIGHGKLLFWSILIYKIEFVLQKIMMDFSKVPSHEELDDSKFKALMFSR